MVTERAIEAEVEGRATRLDSVRVVGGAVLLWVVVTWSAAFGRHHSPLASDTWARWDTINYVDIARRGYSLYRCTDSGFGHQPGDWCGITGWFPGYAYALRAFRWTGLGEITIGWLLATAAMVGTLIVLWCELLRHHPRRQALLAMAMAAVFPGAVYYGAVYPISFVTLSMVATLACIRRERWLLAGVCGMLAAVSYPSGVLVAAAAVAPLVARSAGSWRSRVLAAVSVAGPVLGAYVLVLLEFQRTVGNWRAWFYVQGNNRYETVLPLETLWNRLTDLLDGNDNRWVLGQTMLLLALMVAVAVIVVRNRRQLAPVEWAALAVTALLWLMPLSIGGGLSLQRAEALVLPAVVLLVRARPWVLVTATVACAVVANRLADLYFWSWLI